MSTMSHLFSSILLLSCRASCLKWFHASFLSSEACAMLIGPRTSGLCTVLWIKHSHLLVQYADLATWCFFESSFPMQGEGGFQFAWNQLMIHVTHSMSCFQGEIWNQSSLFIFFSKKTILSIYFNPVLYNSLVLVRFCSCFFFINNQFVLCFQAWSITFSIPQKFLKPQWQEGWFKNFSTLSFLLWLHWQH